MKDSSPHILLNRNEVVQGPSPKCLSVLRHFRASHAALYVDDYFKSILRPKLSRLFNIAEGRILIGYGTEDIFRTIFDGLDPKEDTVLTHKFHYTYYDKYTRFKGIGLENFGMIENKRDFAFDIDDCLAKIKKFRPKVVIITSPNNPTGNTISIGDLSLLLGSLPRNTLAVLDEAYFGFDPGHNEKPFISLLNEYDNLIILRSFSKLYSLAGMRIGFGLCGKNVKNILRYQDRYLGIGRILEEVAVAAIESRTYYKKLARQIIDDRESFIKKTNMLKNFKAYASKANFVLVGFNAGIKPILERELECAKTLISKFVSDRFMRVTVGSKIRTTAFLKLLARVDRKAFGSEKK